MIHCKRALKKWEARNKNVKNDGFIKVKGNTLTIEIQDGPINDDNQAGLQVSDLLEFVKDIFVELGNDYPCVENTSTINSIQEALLWQSKRTHDRVRRGVEGSNIL